MPHGIMIEFPVIAAYFLYLVVHFLSVLAIPHGPRRADADLSQHRYTSKSWRKVSAETHDGSMCARVDQLVIFGINASHLK